MAPLRPSLKPPFCGSGTCKDGMEWPLVACLLIEEENQGLVLCNRVGLKNLLHSIYTSPPPSAEAIKPNCRLFHQRSLASSAGTRTVLHPRNPHQNQAGTSLSTKIVHAFAPKDLFITIILQFQLESDQDLSEALVLGSSTQILDDFNRSVSHVILDC
ncbi:hypothetical protein TWF569_007719 [Orbilia oligospora]|nr:hypothetical protein TWF706_000507 [Orbilia oligospora]KAF3137799.1 hypothetical protein TWF594_007449 [Orbilia oligospora]KAF3141948.1 hypothetical protein TWF569_007719 [Orbilia oligospora]